MTVYLFGIFKTSVFKTNMSLLSISKLFTNLTVHAIASTVDPNIDFSELSHTISSIPQFDTDPELKQILESHYSGEVSGFESVQYGEGSITGEFYDISELGFAERYSFFLSPEYIKFNHIATETPPEFGEVDELDFARTGLKEGKKCKDGFKLCTNPSTGYRYCIPEGWKCATERGKEPRSRKAKPTPAQAAVISDLIQKGTRKGKAKSSVDKTTTLKTSGGDIELTPQEIKVITGHDKLTSVDRKLLKGKAALVMLGKRIAETGDPTLMRKWEGSVLSNSDFDGTVPKTMLADLDAFNARASKSKPTRKGRSLEGRLGDAVTSAKGKSKQAKLPLPPDELSTKRQGKELKDLFNKADQIKVDSPDSKGKVKQIPVANPDDETLSPDVQSRIKDTRKVLQDIEGLTERVTGKSSKKGEQIKLPSDKYQAQTQLRSLATKLKEIYDDPSTQLDADGEQRARGRSYEAAFDAFGITDATVAGVKGKPKSLAKIDLLKSKLTELGIDSPDYLSQIRKMTDAKSQDISDTKDEMKRDKKDMQSQKTELADPTYISNIQDAPKAYKFALAAELLGGRAIELDSQSKGSKLYGRISADDERVIDKIEPTLRTKDEPSKLDLVKNLVSGKSTGTDLDAISESSKIRVAASLMGQISQEYLPNDYSRATSAQKKELNAFDDFRDTLQGWTNDSRDTDKQTALLSSLIGTTAKKSDGDKSDRPSSPDTEIQSQVQSKPVAKRREVLQGMLTQVSMK